MRFFTSQYRYSGPNRVDITVKSGVKSFAPTWDLVMGHKVGTITDEEYTDRYKQLMRESYKNNRRTWDKLLAQDEVVIVCFCSGKGFCHRFIFAEILQKLGAEYLGELDLPKKK